MKSTSSWLTLCLCLVLGTSILCTPLIEKRQTKSCSVDIFSCTNGECIDSLLVCDGLADCSDKSDETQKLCTAMFKTCPRTAFRCNYGACVSNSAKCNGRNDCVDGSDENLAECKKLSLNIPSKPVETQQTQVTSQSNCKALEEFSCTSGQCIDITTICDGVSDCRDGSDETSNLCKSNVCREGTFMCNYGACISKQRKCDGLQHCVDGSDEANCGGYTKDYYTSTKATPTTKITWRPTTATSEPHHETSPVPVPVNNYLKNTCVVPNTEGTLYSLISTDSDQNTPIAPGTRVNLSAAVEENCEEGYHKTTSNRVIYCSRNGKWKPDAEKLCLRRCPPMISDSLNIGCTFNGNKYNCSNPSIPGTVLTPKCKTTHTVPNGQIETPIKLHCQQNGEWSGRLYTCIPYCGRPYVSNRPLILNGKKAQYGSAPWNVGVYRKSDNNKFGLICGGTLISQNLVVSAAHCFWYETLMNRIIINDGTYKVALGKYMSDITIMDNEFTQIVDVGLIYVKDDYEGSSAYHANDIAIIVLPSKITVSDVVLPVCLDWSKQYPVSNGLNGKVVGWGKTEKATESPVLLEASLPYIDQKTCRNMYSNGFEIFVNIGKFCAGTKTGQGVHQGDSGSGLTFVHSSLHFLTGVVSVKDANTNDSIAVFTDVRRYITWINEIYVNHTYLSDQFTTMARLG